MTSVVTIEEQTGKKRRLELRGCGVPLKGAPWGGETAVVTTWYSGNKQASQQVLSPRLIPADWEGMWRTPLLLRDPSMWTAEAGTDPIPVGYASELWKCMEALQEGGQLLRVTWWNVSPTPFDAAISVPQRSLFVVRVGRLTKFEPHPDTLDDIGWSATFTWVGKGDAAGARVQAVPQDLLAAIQTAITSQEGVSAATNTALRAPPTRFTIGDLEQMTQAPLAMFDSFARAVDSVTSRLKDLGDVIVQTRAIPAQLIGRALDTANYAVSTANNFLDTMSRTPIEVLANRSRASMLTRAASYYGGGMTQAQYMADVNADMAAAAQRRRAASRPDTAGGGAVGAPDLLAVYMPRRGDTFDRIAQRYYGTEAVGAALARANGLPGYTIAPPQGVALIIPTRQILDSLVTPTT